MSKNFVYIYYSSKDYSDATKICIFLESKGINCWLSPRNVLSSLDYNAQVTAAINDCKLAILVATKETNDINTLPNELNILATKKKTIAYFKTENFDISDTLTYYYQEIKSFNAYDNFEIGLNLLYNEISLLINETKDEKEEVVEAQFTTIEENKKDFNNEEIKKEQKYTNNTENENKSEYEKNTENNKSDYKYCTNCGSRMPASFSICTNCGKLFENNNNEKSKFDFTSTKPDKNIYQLIIFIFMIISTITSASLIIPLFWCIPMTVIYWEKMKKNEKVSMTFKICTLILVGIIPGILMLCEDHVK